MPLQTFQQTEGFAVPTTEPVATVDYSNFIEGVDTQILYGYVIHGTSSVEYKLGESQFPSTNEPLSGNIIPYIESTTGTLTNTGSAALTLSRTFTSGAFNRSRTLKGTAKAVFGMGHVISASDVGIQYYWVVTLYRYDGSTQTQLGTTQTEEVSTGTGNGLSGVFVVDVDIGDNVVIPEGEMIQCKIDVYSYKGGTGTSYELIMGHDGLNRDGNKITPSASAFAQTRLEVHLPFKRFEQ